jgi:hypothetical protein
MVHRIMRLRWPIAPTQQCCGLQSCADRNAHPQYGSERGRRGCNHDRADGNEQASAAAATAFGKITKLRVLDVGPRVTSPPLSSAAFPLFPTM